MSLRCDLCIKGVRFVPVFFLILLSLQLVCCRPNQAKSPNVLFICVDDLRPELGCYGNSQIVSPSLDRLAGEGVIFTNHFVNVPTCGASRWTLLTGMLPRTTGQLDNHAIREYISGRPEGELPETFIHHLKRNGYTTVGIGKIGHYADGFLYGYEDPQGTRRELPHSWNKVLFDPGKWESGWNAFFAYADGSNRQSRKKMVKPYEKAEVEDEGYPDGLTAALAVSKLQELAAGKRPFFMGVGFFKPHLPFNAPKKYWDLYEESQLPLTPSPNIPMAVNVASLHESGEFNQYQLGEEKASLAQAVSEAYTRKLTHAYYACISYVDAQIGKILAELKRLGLEQNTLVVVWGDHGWHLGDHRVWGKHTLFERALKSVLIIKAPGMKSKGLACDSIVSSIDIYPTLMKLCGVDMPYPSQGRSLDVLWNESDKTHWENAAYGYYRKGITVRTERYRLTRYFRDEQPTIELYDHATDPFENQNIAHDFPDIIKLLLPIWARGNTGVFEKQQE
ncbi:MAG: sulfatase-like hydrolase/transferase [Candidatus Aminicenantes bacterium]|nr:sulfatase-like hydrolase/transferase [Candidatus Aminicenantes bacterium]